MNEYEFFRKATRAICGHLEVERALWASMRLINQFIPGDQLFLELYEWDKGIVRTVARATTESGERIDVVVPMSQEAVSHAEGVESFETIIVNDPSNNPMARELNRALGGEGSACLVLPLAVEGTPLGILVLTRNSGEPFVPEDARLIQLLNEPFAIALTNALRHDEVLRLKNLVEGDNRFLRRELRSLAGDKIVGADFGLRQVMENVAQVAPTDSPVMLLGETGVGKDVIASAIHASSSRRDGPFIKVNSGAIPDSLIDSELFGHEKGAFTGALSRKRGRFERASGGTLFLDEIGELPPQAQVRLLRVLQSHEIERVGGTEPINVDVRILSATHRDLKSMVSEGSFREDLWFRLNVFPIEIPPLRQRREDIRALVHHFVELKSRELKRGSPPDLAPSAMESLLAYDWPGNVRELDNILERALILHRSGYLEIPPLSSAPLPQTSVGAATSADDAFLTKATDDRDRFATLDKAMSAHIERALELCDGKIHGPGGAAELLEVKANTLRTRMDKLGVVYKKRGNRQKRSGLQ